MVCVGPGRKPECWFSHDAAHIHASLQGVQNRMVLVVIFFVFLKLLIFALLLFMNKCTMSRIYFTFLNCLQHLEIFSEIWVMLVKLQIAVSQPSYLDAVSSSHRPYIASALCTRSNIATTKQKIKISKIRKN